MISFAGSKGSLKLFVDNDSAVVVDTTVNMIVGSGDASAVFASYEWDEPTGSVETSVLELASSALTTLDINVITASGRMYTIPDGAKAEAKKALEWRKEEKRGGTPVGLNTARTLAKGGQIGIEKIRHIAKYFPRHEVDKKGKGWKPGEDNFPSNGRIAWALWGGDAAWRWASAIVERENKKSLRAGGYATPGYDRSVDIYSTPHTYGSDIDSFKSVYELDPTSGPEFMARVRLDGSGFDRLYKIETDGRVCVWDDGRWDDLGHVDGDVWSYDSALDDEYDDCEKDHILLDPQTAMLMSAMWQNDPYRFISIDDIDPEEASLVREAYPQEDWKVVDYVLTAAGESFAPSTANKPSGSINPNDNVDTPAEKAQRASSQQRDGTGKFAQAGGRVVVGGDATNGRGTLVGIGSDGMGTVELDNGRTVDVPVKLTKPESESEAAPVAPNPAVGKPLDVDGILGEPRTPKDMPAARLPGTYPPMGTSDLKAVVNDWGNWVNEQRAAFKPLTDGDVKDYASRTGQKIATVKEGKIVTQKLTPRAADKANAGKPVINPQAQGAKIEAKKDNAAAGRAPIAAKPSSRGISTPAQATPIPKPTNRGISTPAQAVPLPKPSSRGISTPAEATPNTTRSSQERLRQVKNAERKADSIAQTEAKRDAATAGRAPKPSGRGISTPAEATPRPKPRVDNQEALRQARNADRKAESAKAASKKDGPYVVQKGDSLWSIAEKNKPAGKSTAEYWAEVMKANPKGNFKSGNPSLIYSGEKVNLPGASGGSTPKKVDNQEKLRQVKNAERKAEKKPIDNQEKLRQAKNAERKADSAKAAADAKAQADGREKLRNVKNAERKADSARAAEASKNQEKLRDARNADRKATPAAKSGQEKLREVKNAERKAETISNTEAKRDAATAGRAPKVEQKKYNPWTDSDQAKSWQPVGKAIGDAADGLGKAVSEGAKSLFQPQVKKSGKAGTRKKKNN